MKVDSLYPSLDDNARREIVKEVKRALEHWPRETRVKVSTVRDYEAGTQVTTIEVQRS